MLKRLKKWTSVILAASLLPAMFMPAGTTEVKAAGQYEDVFINQRKIYNASTISKNPAVPAISGESDVGEYDAWMWFYQQSRGAGFPGVNIAYGGDSLSGGTEHASDFKGSIHVADIPGLQALAASGQGQFRFFINTMWESDDDFISMEVETNRSGYYKYREENGGSNPDRNDNVDTGWQTLDPNDVITITLVRDGTAAFDGLHLYFRDITPPKMEDYQFTSTGTERDNTTIGEKELFIKADENLKLDYPFSELVKPSSPGDAADLNVHYLFTNPAGTGLPGAGQNQAMKLPASTNWSQFTDRLAYSYSPTPLHHSGNLPIKNGGELMSLPSSGGLNDYSLKEKIIAADFHDPAGNPLIVSNFGKKASAAGSSFLSGKAINPFDEHVDPDETINGNDGYRVIVDAVPPKYSFVANGIQPEIVTGSTLNGGDVIDFKVQLTEKVIIKDSLDSDDLFLYFNNGMKAKYVSGMNEDVWMFEAKVTDADVDVALLKVIALTHESRAPGYADKGVIQDYAGNLLMDAANTSKSSEPVPTDPSQRIAETKIDWAKLSIDNQDPEFSYNYDSDGATDAVYGKKGKITIDANDPSVTAPPLDPDEAGFVRPSRGIYRPLNMTGGTGSNSPGVGLVFYYWSNNAENPLKGKEADHYAAVKRYSLTGLQPSNGLYPDLTGLKFMVANNKTNLLSPPAEALASEASGPWYLHTWTADMTWDTARELMQYKKKKVFETDNAAQYAAWKNEYLAGHPGASDADAEIYASGKALVAVGEYENLAMWTPDDFKFDDSNWIYNKATLLLDNKAPELYAELGSGQDTAQVEAKITATDKHSGIDPAKLQYQWVKENEAPSGIAWSVVPADHIVSTQNHVFEDGSYVLYLQAADYAGNTTAAQMKDVAKVNSSKKMEISFSSTSDTYMKSRDVEFSFKGIENSIQVEEIAYTFSNTVVRPADGQFKPTVSAAVYGNNPTAGDLTVDTGITVEPSVTNSVYGANTVTSAVYDAVVRIPADTTLNGEQYLHIRVKELDGQNYYFNQLYKLDNTAPAVTFNINGVNYAKPSHTVVVTATEPYRQDGMTVKYLWLREEIPAPGEGTAGWQTLPEDHKAVLDNSGLVVGETANFILYVLAADGAGNTAVTHTGTFLLSREDDRPVQVLQSDLIAFEGNDTDGYKAVLQLELQNSTKDGYEYAVSKDNGATWTTWMPYTNFVRISVDEKTPSQLKLKVKFRSPYGGESSPADVDTKGFNPEADPLYGIVSYSTLKSVGSGAVALTISVPAGVKVKPSTTENPAAPVHAKGNTYNIPQNGVYTFDMTDLTAPDRNAKLVAVVKNIDDTPPEGVIVYNITGPTSSNVTAELQTSEPVRVLNNDGSRRHIFTENDTFTFEFEDEAGNKNTLAATVGNIDKTPPSVKIVAAYTYGTNGSKTFKTITDNQGNVVLAEGVVLSAAKTADSAKDFTIVQGQSPVTMLENGKVEFAVRDQMGNTTVLEQEIAYIAPAFTAPQIVYEYVDENGTLLPPEKIVTIGGKTYAKGKVKVTLSGQVGSPNKIFLGTAPSLQDGSYVNQLSGPDGSYSHSAVYSTNGRTRIAITDLLGHTVLSQIEVSGLDNTAPELVLNRPVASLIRNQVGFNPYTDLGGYTVSDNLSAADNLTVSISDLDLTKTGKQTVTYTVTDEVGNSTSISQSVVVMPDTGLLITGNGEILSANAEESILFDTNKITFRVQGYDEMMVGGAKATNERATFTILYHSGLYREGQMKYIAEEISYEALTAQQFQVTFPKAGWYTIIVRTQEREREFASFFVGNTD
ncbi:MAG: hypothetical protein K0Q90_84 [Paenibacillaceae bacterium]|nr:hypothetical protein [Paenibacillaceae bacterium]